MIAMQYRFPLPADYDMAIIDRRIADKGHLTDGFPGLLFKATSARARRDRRRTTRMRRSMCGIRSTGCTRS